MEFLTTSKFKVIAQLNAREGKLFGPLDFAWSVPSDVDGLTNVTLTPIGQANSGHPITLRYPRIEIEDVQHVQCITDGEIEKVLAGIEHKYKVQIDRDLVVIEHDTACACITINDYVIKGTVLVEVAHAEQ